jgi:beta-mannanase
MTGLNLGMQISIQPSGGAVSLDLSKKRLGVRAANATDLSSFETWLGAPADTILVFTDSGSWANVLTKAQNEGSAVSGLGRDLSWAIPLAVSGTSLAQVASGAADSHYEQLADIILALSPDTGPIVCRLGWEMNLAGNYPWDAIGHEADYIAAFQRIATLLRTKSRRFKFDWCLNYGRSVDPTTFYPGDAYVDIIGMDCYMDT